MLSWDDYENNAEEAAVVNDAALQTLNKSEQPATPPQVAAPLIAPMSGRGQPITARTIRS